MPEQFARIAALALVGVCALIFLLLVALFGTPAVETPRQGLPRLSDAQIRPPTADSRSPTADRRSPTADRQQPTTDRRPPTADTPTDCPNPATPEPLWVDPVLSPTDALSQKISVTLGRGREISIASEAGTVTLRGNFSNVQPVEIEIPLLPNTTHNLVVSGRVEYASGCFYTLQTRIDRMGNPLVIVQRQNGSVTRAYESPTPWGMAAVGAGQRPIPTMGNGRVGALTVTPLPGAVYVKPFSQVFGVGQEYATSPGAVWLYQAGGDPFRIVAEEGAHVRVQALNGTLNFWTLRSNLVSVPVMPPSWDESVRGREVQVVGGNVYGCEGSLERRLTLGRCMELLGIRQVTLRARVVLETSLLYVVEVNGAPYWISGNALVSP